MIRHRKSSPSKRHTSKKRLTVLCSLVYAFTGEAALDLACWDLISKLADVPPLARIQRRMEQHLCRNCLRLGLDLFRVANKITFYLASYFNFAFLEWVTSWFSLLIHILHSPALACVVTIFTTRSPRQSWQTHRYQTVVRSGYSALGYIHWWPNRR